MIGQRLEVRQGQGLVITPQLQQAIKLLQLSNLELEAFVEGANGAIVMPDENGTDWPTPADAVGTDPVWVGRVRQVESNPHTLDFIVCGDNIRKGAALNALQIAEMLVGVGRYAQA